MNYFTYMESPIGPLAVRVEAGVLTAVGLWRGGGPGGRDASSGPVRDQVVKKLRFN